MLRRLSAWFLGAVAGATLVLTTGCVVPGPALLPTDGPLERQVVRVVERHDVYVKADESLLAGQAATFLAESKGALALFEGDEDAQVPSDVVELWLSPVMSRHDEYVDKDLKLDPLERETFLASTTGLRSLLAQALEPH